MHAFSVELNKIAGVEVEHGDVPSGTDRVVKATSGESSPKDMDALSKQQRTDKAVELIRTYKGS